MQVERGFSTFQRGWRVGLAVAMHIYKHRVEFTPHPSPLPEERELICGLFGICVRLGISGRRYSRIQLGQFLLPLGEG
ncbi:hypothetical protein BK675_19480 [Pseudomonas fluorescens]|nr:hypothetical protein BK677_07210 [Pseudomonas fluorescens]ROO06659.1 hypothetical protein BK675_19480 [Pseudomonas fluorescens]ROO15614.1 hypothetical protein BK676_15710 [Pseudomonas fluorescens]